MLRDLLDHQMQCLDRLEQTIAGAGWSADQVQIVINDDVEHSENTVAEILDPESHPDRCLFELAEFLGNVEDEEIRALAQSEAAGNPPLGFEFVVSCQVKAALLRGHLLATEA
jgi:hypothetical protein